MTCSTELVERAELLASMRGFARTGGCLLFVTGEAGIGKTALVNTFCDGLGAGTAVYRGACDALTTPRALGPLFDIARTGPAGLGRLLAAGHDRHTIFTGFLDLLATGPSVTVVEDAHWADEATLDLLLFLGRRVGELPATVVVTYRGEEIDRDHPLRRVLGELATARSVRRLTVPALSEAAVAVLAEPAGRDGAQLHAVTGGNPFFVTEALATPGQDVPSTVRDAVLARASRLSAAGRAVLDVVSLVPDRVGIALLESAFAVGAEALDEGIQAGMLVLDGPAVRFRHELARRAVEADVPAAYAVGLHSRILAFLTAVDAVDPARLAYHADAAGDSAAVLRYAPVAAELASGMGAHREAAAHYAQALRHTAGSSTSQLAHLWERRADACERGAWTHTSSGRSEQLAEALDASARAVELSRAAGDLEREAVVTARRAHVLRSAGRTAEAHDTARTAIALLEAVPPGRGQAMAYVAVARVMLIARHMPAAVALGTTAVSYAEKYGETGPLGWALGVVGSASWTTDPDRAVELSTAGLDAAREAGDDLAAAVGFGHLGVGATEVRLYEQADRWLAEAVEWSTERDMDGVRAFVRACQARSLCEQGRWSEADTVASEVVGMDMHNPMPRAIGLVVAGRLRARRGDPDPATPLDRAWAIAEQLGDLPLLWQAAAARAEAAWLAGRPDAIGPLVTDTYRLAVRLEHGWAAGELGHWLSVAGAGEEPTGFTALPWARQMRGDPRGAARLWRQLGCPYEAASAMAGSDDPDDRLAALNELRRLGAWAAAELLSRRLREQGVRKLPRAPRRTTRNNPAQLTDRQVDILALLTEGLRNADIAARLHISPRTVDHHVTAVLAKLGVGSRLEAARWAPPSAAEDGRSATAT
jgi:DNA-binding CsgD family transcriptional regulator/tetratricopeptide (TPR) repeat protein